MIYHHHPNGDVTIVKRVTASSCCFALRRKMHHARISSRSPSCAKQVCNEPSPDRCGFATGVSRLNARKLITPNTSSGETLPSPLTSYLATSSSRPDSRCEINTLMMVSASRAVVWPSVGRDATPTSPAMRLRSSRNCTPSLLVVRSMRFLLGKETSGLRTTTFVAEQVPPGFTHCSRSTKCDQTFCLAVSRSRTRESQATPAADC